MIHHVEERAPLRRTVTQQEVGSTATFLASPLASGMGGQVPLRGRGLLHHGALRACLREIPWRVVLNWPRYRATGKHHGKSAAGLGSHPPWVCLCPPVAWPQGGKTPLLLQGQLALHPPVCAPPVGPERHQAQTAPLAGPGSEGAQRLVDWPGPMDWGISVILLSISNRAPQAWGMVPLGNRPFLRLLPGDRSNPCWRGVTAALRHGTNPCTMANGGGSVNWSPWLYASWGAPAMITTTRFMPWRNSKLPEGTSKNPLGRARSAMGLQCSRFTRHQTCLPS